ncbi:hypothetical protein ACFL2C_02580 [Patescibacteria group bacterium]
MRQKSQGIAGIIIILIVAISLFTLAFFGFRSLVSQNGFLEGFTETVIEETDFTEDFKGEFVEICKDEMTSSEIDLLAAGVDVDLFCGCTYDRLVDTYGEETLIQYTLEVGLNKREPDFIFDALDKCFADQADPQT